MIEKFGRRLLNNLLIRLIEILESKFHRGFRRNFYEVKHHTLKKLKFSCVFFSIVEFFSNFFIFCDSKKLRCSTNIPLFHVFETDCSVAHKIFTDAIKLLD